MQRQLQATSAQGKGKTRMKDKAEGLISREGTDEGWRRWKNSCTSTLDVMERRDQGMRGETGVREKKPADKPICSTELVMLNCSSTCFWHTHTRLKVVAGNQDSNKPIYQPESLRADLLTSHLQTFLSDVNGQGSGDENVLLTVETSPNDDLWSPG